MMSAGKKQSKQVNLVKVLTDWRREDEQHKQERNRASKWRHSQTSKQQISNISSRETEGKQEALTD